mmetsp:Transcript_10401/g.25036  ORF Transcript_10401/g.25036 Transcript_10401/m.25036 type:complete len:346 (-) Transcript_10401:789-1826(-)
MAAADGVRAAEGDDVAVAEAHPVEDGAKVARALRCVWQPAVSRAEAAVGEVLPAERVRHGRPAHPLDRLAAGERPQVSVRHVREALLHTLEQVVNDEQPRIRRVGALWLKAHRAAVAPSRRVLRVVRPAGVPCDAHRHRASVHLLVDQCVAHGVSQSVVIDRRRGSVRASDGGGGARCECGGGGGGGAIISSSGCGAWICVPRGAMHSRTPICRSSASTRSLPASAAWARATSNAKSSPRLPCTPARMASSQRYLICSRFGRSGLRYSRAKTIEVFIASVVSANSSIKLCGLVANLSARCTASSRSSWSRGIASAERVTPMRSIRCSRSSASSGLNVAMSRGLHG